MRSERPTPSLARTERVQKPVAGRLATLPPVFLHTRGDDHPQAGRCPHMRAHEPNFPLVTAVLCSDSWLPGPLHTRFVSQSHPVPGGPILPISQKTRLRHKEVRKLLVGAGGLSNSKVHTHLGAVKNNTGDTCEPGTRPRQPPVLPASWTITCPPQGPLCSQASPRDIYQVQTEEFLSLLLGFPFPSTL